MPNFNEGWYPDSDLEELRGAARAASLAEGLILELGSWEGRSALVIAAEFPSRPVYCVDSWARPYCGVDRDVHAQFLLNTQDAINIFPVRSDVLEYLRRNDGPVAFAHVDADHSYEHVAETLRLLKSRCSRGAVLCGHDWSNEPAVQRAVREVLPDAQAGAQVWYWKA